SQLRMVCALGSNCLASSSGLRLARTRAISLRRNSAGYGGLDFDMVNTSFSKDYVSTKPGQLHALPWPSFCLTAYSLRRAKPPRNIDISRAQNFGPDWGHARF